MKNKTLEEETRDILKKYNIRAAKKYGQNFLTDEKVLHRIMNTALIGKSDFVLEIGPGLGTLTRLLCDEAKKVAAVEIDTKLIDTLKITMSSYDNFNLINEDILKTDIKSLLTDNFETNKCKVVANLPYYITTPIIMKLLEERLNIETVTIMVQKEVAERLAAAPGGKDYGAISVAVQYYSIPEIIETVPAAAFMPKPDVDSSIIHLIIRDKPPVSPLDEGLFFKVVRASFAQRRKTLLNSLHGSNLGIEKSTLQDILKKCGINCDRRGETLSLEEFALLSNEIGLFLKK